MANSYGEHFQHCFDADDKDFNNLGYLKSHFDVSGFCNTNPRSMINSNVIGRIYNGLVEAINKQTLLPKAIIVVLENDLIRAAHHDTDGISQILGQALEWLAGAFRRAIAAHKERLPTKSRKFKYPHILWVTAVHHSVFSRTNNDFRKKFNICLHNVAALYCEMSVLMLHTWDTRDNALILQTKPVLSATGLTKFWQCLDTAVQKWDHDQLNLSHRAQKSQPQAPLIQHDGQPQARPTFQDF